MTTYQPLAVITALPEIRPDLEYDVWASIAQPLGLNAKIDLDNVFDLPIDNKYVKSIHPHLDGNYDAIMVGFPVKSHSHPQSVEIVEYTRKFINEFDATQVIVRVFVDDRDLKRQVAFHSYLPEPSEPREGLLTWAKVLPKRIRSRGGTPVEWPDLAHLDSALDPGNLLGETLLILP